MIVWIRAGCNDVIDSRYLSHCISDRGLILGTTSVALFLPSKWIMYNQFHGVESLQCQSRTYPSFMVSQVSLSRSQRHAIAYCYRPCQFIPHVLIYLRPLGERMSVRYWVIWYGNNSQLFKEAKGTFKTFEDLSYVYFHMLGLLWLLYQVLDKHRGMWYHL
jgi:hypothetical protein